MIKSDIPAETENAIAGALEKILSGKVINKKLGNWRISNLNGPAAVSFSYEEGCVWYGFSVSSEDDSIHFRNYHRESGVIGMGTVSLRQLESSFESLASQQQKPIEVSFYLFSQKDTELWLKKNNYVKIDDQTYAKRFYPTQRPTRNAEVKISSGNESTIEI